MQPLMKPHHPHFIYSHPLWTDPSRLSQTNLSSIPTSSLNTPDISTLSLKCICLCSTCLSSMSNSFPLHKPRSHGLELGQRHLLFYPVSSKSFLFHASLWNKQPHLKLTLPNILITYFGFSQPSSLHNGRERQHWLLYLSLISLLILGEFRLYNTELVIQLLLFLTPATFDFTPTQPLNYMK